MNIFNIPKNRVIIFPVKLTGPHGDKWVQAIFDTGATYSMFPPSVIKAIGYDLSQACDTVKIITASSVEYVPIITVPAIELFGTMFKNVQVVSHLLPPSTPAQGLIGINLINRFDYELLFSRNELIVRL